WAKSNGRSTATRTIRAMTNASILVRLRETADGVRRRGRPARVCRTRSEDARSCRRSPRIMPYFLFFSRCVTPVQETWTLRAPQVLANRSSAISNPKPDSASLGPRSRSPRRTARAPESGRITLGGDHAGHFHHGAQARQSRPGLPGRLHLL